MVRGYQGDGLSDPTAALAYAKHFAGYSETLGGRDASEADLSPRKLRSWFLPPFEQAVRARPPLASCSATSPSTGCPSPRTSG
ncbi:Putative beta-xylosidase [Streptomyces violarus]